MKPQNINLVTTNRKLYNNQDFQEKDVTKEGIVSMKLSESQKRIIFSAHNDRIPALVGLRYFYHCEHEQNLIILYDNTSFFLFSLTIVSFSTPHLCSPSNPSNSIYCCTILWLLTIVDCSSIGSDLDQDTMGETKNVDLGDSKHFWLETFYNTCKKTILAIQTTENSHLFLNVKMLLACSEEIKTCVRIGKVLF